MNVEEIVATLLSQGFSARDIRRQLSSRGIRWQYNFTPHSGKREAIRRRRVLQLCEKGCGGRRVTGSDLCPDCLAAKWLPK